LDWSRIKTIFIIAFLILDLFLLSQLTTKHKTNQFELKSNTTLEENLKTDGIVYDELPKEAIRDQYMSANTKIFTEEEIAELKSTGMQHVYTEDGTVIHAKLTTPIVIDEKQDSSELIHFIGENIFQGEQYGFWNLDQEAGTITYYQKFNDKLLFMNRSAHLIFYLNEENEVESYEQTMLETIAPINEPEEVLPAIRAIEALYKKRGFEAR